MSHKKHQAMVVRPSHSHLKKANVEIPSVKSGITILSLQILIDKYRYGLHWTLRILHEDV